MIITLPKVACKQKPLAGVEPRPRYYLVRRRAWHTHQSDSSHAPFGRAQPTKASGKSVRSVRIIGIDPGLRRTGWGIIDSDGVRLAFVACGSVCSDDGEALGIRLRQLFDGLQEVLARLSPVEAAIEQTFVNRDASATLKLGQARGIAMLVPALSGVTIAEYAPNAIKKTVVGAGHGDKVQIRAMVARLLPRAVPDSADAVDALAIAITHAHCRTWRRLEAAVALAARSAS
jgi:crossover junction endodeoxyribonuclease RuvC